MASQAPRRIVGLDGEMSGNAIEDGCVLIQIGVAIDSISGGDQLDVPEVFSSLIGWPEGVLDRPGVWQEAAAKIHGITRDQLADAPPAIEVDALLYQWLGVRGFRVDQRRELVLTGFNVGAFDVPFVRAALPLSSRLFGRQYADLNAVCFLLGASVDPVEGGRASFGAWKRRMSDAGLEFARRSGRTEPVHQAGTDALIALGAWREAERLLFEMAVQAAETRRTDRDLRKAAAAASEVNDA